MTTEETNDVEIISSLMGFPAADIKVQFSLGHRPYLARFGTLPVAVGWSAGGQIGLWGGRLTFHVPPGNRYLYAFITHPAWRGRGIYPHLLQTILRRESQHYQRFWIIHLLENTASQRGIHKAGFHIAATISRLSSGGHVLLPPADNLERARAASILLGLSLRP
jgi:GNAT superfamily N-acetyltransferase